MISIRFCILAISIVLLVSRCGAPYKTDGLATIETDKNTIPDIQLLDVKWNLDYSITEHETKTRSGSIKIYKQHVNKIILKGFVKNHSSTPLESVIVTLRIEGQSPPYPLVKEIALGWTDKENGKMLEPRQTREFYHNTLANKVSDKVEGMLRIDDVFLHISSSSHSSSHER